MFDYRRVLKLPFQYILFPVDLVARGTHCSSRSGIRSMHPTAPAGTPKLRPGGDVKPSCSQIRDAEGISKGTGEVQQTIRPQQRISSTVPLEFQDEPSGYAWLCHSFGTLYPK